MELRPKDNKVDIWTLSQKLLRQMNLHKTSSNNWRNGVEVPFPDEKTHIERELTISEGLLPDDLKVERGDVVQRAMTEWHFVVLSAKLNEVYQTELAEFKEKIDH